MRRYDKDVVDSYVVTEHPILRSLFSLALPADAQVLHAAIKDEDGMPRLWALCRVAAPLVQRYFWLCGTGHDYAREVRPGVVPRHVSTFQGVGLVFHLFELVVRTGEPVYGDMYVGEVPR